jgi:release factor glutamine methyltransferase
MREDYNDRGILSRHVMAPEIKAEAHGRGPVTVTLWRLLLRLRFLLTQRQRHDRLVLEEDLPFPLIVLPGVFNPALFRTSGFALEALAGGLIADDASVLDLGTGSGVLAVAAARTAARVVAVDSNLEAVRCTRINALLNRVEDRIEVRNGEFFEAVAEDRFDVVLCNPPYYRGRPGSPLGEAFSSDDFAERFSAGLPDHLETGGSALVVLSTDGDESGFLRAFAAAGLDTEIESERDLISETVRLYRLR